MQFVKMIGLALDGSGVMKEQDVLPNNVAAFKAAGWVEGELPKPEVVEAIEEVAEVVEEVVQKKRRR